MVSLPYCAGGNPTVCDIVPVRDRGLVLQAAVLERDTTSAWEQKKLEARKCLP
jgi:hypothetical protein